MIGCIDDNRAATGRADLQNSADRPVDLSRPGGTTGGSRKASSRTRRDRSTRRDPPRLRGELWGYGVRKVWQQLGREGVSVARCTVARLMRQMGLRGVVRGKETRTTIAGKAPCPADRVNRQFRSARPNLLWLADFSVPQQAA